MPDGLVAMLSKRLGKDIALACENVTDAHGLLGPDEEAAIARAVPKRQAEFAAGRRAARKAIRALGAAEVAIPSAETRAPIWPNGFVGSITHDQGVALAAVAKASEIKALGIDLTQAAPLPGTTRRAILTAPEEATLGDLEARAAFAIKECLFKTLHPSVQSFFGFEAAIAKPDFEAERFMATLTCELGPFEKGAVFSGILLNTQGLIVTALSLPAHTS